VLPWTSLTIVLMLPLFVLSREVMARLADVAAELG
jgi:hypothetical protein